MKDGSRYESPAWISAAMDDAGLTAAEFRVLAHVCRRAGDGANGRGCDASIPSMAQVCGMKGDTIRQALKRLVSSGWLEAEERTGKATVYWPRLPSSDPSPKTVGVSPNPSPQTVANPSPDSVGDPSRLGGAEGNPKGKPKGNGTHTRPDLDEVIHFAEASGIPRDCAEKFWMEKDAVGWLHRGQPIYRWQSLLRAYASAWSQVEAKKGQPGKLPQMSLEEAIKSLGRRARHLPADEPRKLKAATEYPEPLVIPKILNKWD